MLRRAFFALLRDMIDAQRAAQCAARLEIFFSANCDAPCAAHTGLTTYFDRMIGSSLLPSGAG
jgi:hypothetical protein